MSQDYKYSFPGQHTYDGITLGAVYKPSVLDRVKKFNFKESDILIAGYPKSGNVNNKKLIVYVFQRSFELIKGLKIFPNMMQVDHGWRRQYGCCRMTLTGRQQVKKVCEVRGSFPWTYL